MIDKTDFDRMIKLYQMVMIEPLVAGKGLWNPLECDEYDTIEIIHSYDHIHFSVRFGAIRKRPDKYAIDKMHCVLVDVPMLDIEKWYEGYMKIIEKSKKWEWEH